MEGKRREIDGGEVKTELQCALNERLEGRGGAVDAGNDGGDRGSTEGKELREVEGEADLWGRLASERRKEERGKLALTCGARWSAV